MDENAARLPLVLVRHEVVDLVGDDGATEDATYLLVLERQHFFCDVILGVEAVVTEVPVEAGGEVVRAGAGDGVHLPSRGAALRNVELTRDDLELGDGLAAELGLTKAGTRHLLGDLLAIQVELEALVASNARTIVVGVVGGDALHEQGELHPVATLHRQIVHHAAIHVAGHFRRHQIHEGCFRGDGDRFLDPRERHLDRDVGVLPDQEFDLRQDHGGEAGQRRFHPVGAGWQRGCPESTFGIGHGRLLSSGVVFDHLDRHAR